MLFGYFGIVGCMLMVSLGLTDQLFFSHSLALFFSIMWSGCMSDSADC